MLVRRRNPERDRAGVIDSLIMTLGLSLLSWVALIAPYLHDGSMGTVAKLVSIAYPLGDILLLAAAIRLAVDSGRREPAFYLLALSIVALLVTDFAYGVVTLQGAYDGQVILDVGWISFYLLWGAAALHPSMRSLERPAADRDPKLTPFRLALLTGASLIAPAVEAVHVIDTGDMDLIVIIGASAVLFGLVVARMAGLVRQQERSVARERTLTAAGGALVAATSRDEIALAALDAIESLVGSDAEALLCLVEDDALQVVAARTAAATDVQGWALAPATAGALLGAAADDRRALLPLTAERRADLRIGGDDREGRRPRPVGPLRDPRPARRVRRARRRPRREGRPALARHPGLARARERRADRGGPPPHERGALRLAHPRVERPHHGARLRRADRLPEPVHRARARLHARRGRRHELREPAAAGRAEPPPAPARRRGRLRRRRRHRGPRLHAAPPRRRGAALRDPAHEPARRRARPRHRPQQPRRQRAQGLRGAVAAPGLPRPGHGPREPRAVRRARPPRRRPRPPGPHRPGRHLHRPRRLQDDQRQPRPRRRRPGPARGRQAPGHEHPRQRHRRALRRRRVRRPARGRRVRPGGGRHRRAHPRVARRCRCRSSTRSS